MPRPLHEDGHGGFEARLPGRSTIWSREFLPFVMVVEPGVYIDSVEDRVRTEAEPGRPPGTELITLQHFLAPPEEFEGMVIEHNGDVNIWTTMFVVWVERGHVERLRSALRNPPRGVFDAPER